MIRFRLSSLLCGAILLLYTACSQDEPEPLVLDDPTSQQVPAFNTLRSLEEAKAEALQIFFALQPSLRSARELRIEDAQLLHTDALRSAEYPSDGAFGGIYLINLANNAGYILLSEDRRDEPILALATEGNLNPDEELPEPALMMLGNAIAGRNVQAMDSIDHGSPSDGHSPDQPDAPAGYSTYTEYGPWEVTETIEPLVRVYWGQDAPFNAQLERIDGKLPPVGCVATALMQLMSYHRLPASYDWDAILFDKSSPYSAEVLSSLGKELGRADLLNMQYSLEASSAYTKDVPRTLRYYGYTSSEVEAYNASVINGEIRAGRPVYVSGSTHIQHVTKGWGFFTRIYTSFSGGHAFLLDGLKVLRRKAKSIRYPDGVVRREWYETTELVHCKFGGGMSSPDAYYLHKEFDTTQGEPDLRAIVVKDGKKDYYRYNLKMITSIQPR